VTDRRLVLLCGAALLVACAWPLAIVHLPPYQDVPNHLATVHALVHPGRYPELVSNGFFKTNSVLAAWLVWIGGGIGDVWAMRLFCLLVLATNAFGIPWLLFEVRGRRAVVVGTLFAAPMVHNWFVSMGMLNFAFGCGLAVLLLATMQRQRKTPSMAKAVAIAALALAVWWAHAAPLLVMLLLVAVELAVSRFDAKSIRAALPLLPAVAVAVLRRVPSVGGELRPTPTPFNLAYDLWGEFFYAFTILEVVTLVPCLVLAVLALRAWKQSVPFFSPASLVAVALAYVLLPESYAAFFYLNARLIPFVWLALLVRVPEQVPRGLAIALGAATVAYSAALGVDFVRLTREEAELCAGVPYVAEGARLLPLVLDRRGTSVNTEHLGQAWGCYALEKDTAAPLLFAEQPSFALRHRTPPPEQLTAVAIERFLRTMRSERAFCDGRRESGIDVGDCPAEWRRHWNDFFDVARPHFDHLLFWGADKEVRDVVPPDYRLVFEEGRLLVYARDGI